MTAPATPDLPLAPLPLLPLPERPLVTVLMANYNYARFLPSAIESVLSQDYEPIELIVVDDGSTDDSVAAVERYARRDPRVSLVRKANGGMASAWNAGYAVSHGHILATLDSDDTFAPGKLKAVVDAFDRDCTAGLLVHAMTVVGPDGAAVQRVPFMTRFEHGWIAPQVLRRGGRWRYMPTSALCFRRELGPSIFPVPEQTFRRHADALVVTLGPLLTPVIAIDEPLSCYRVHGGNNLGGDFRDEKTARQVIEFTDLTTRGANQRLAELGLPVRLDAADNLEFLQASFVSRLFDGTPRSALTRHYLSLARALVTDDLYSRPQKLLGLVVYVIAALLPRRTRAAWLGQTLGYSSGKRHLQRVLKVFRTALHPRTTTRRPPPPPPPLPLAGGHPA